MAAIASLLRLARPRALFFVATLPLIGLGYALWERGSQLAPLYVVGNLGLLSVAWSLGHAGSLWLNAELDHDQGGVLLGQPTSVPRFTNVAGYAALLVSLAAGALLGLGPLLCVFGCAALAVLYSHPRVAWKSHPLGGPLVNGFGYGTLSPVAGWLCGDGIFTWRAVLSLAFLVAFILGIYFAAQAFQGREDRGRGYRTLVVTHGPRWTLRVARACVTVGVGGALVAAATGVYPRAVLVAAPLWLWSDRWVARWARRLDGGDSGVASEWIRRLALTGLVALLAIYGHQVARISSGLPAGGCGTVLVPDALSQACTPRNTKD